MKQPFLLCCLALCMVNVSCERHADLHREITALEASLKQDETASQQLEKDIASLGGRQSLDRMKQEARAIETRIRPLEFANGPRERELKAVETRMAALKPAVEAFKTAQPR